MSDERPLTDRSASLDLRDLHCETLQAEVDRLQKEIAELKLQLSQAQPVAPRPPERSDSSSLEGWSALVLAGRPVAQDVAQRFLTFCAGRLLMHPQETLARLASDADLARAVDAALQTSEGSASNSHFKRVHAWAAR